MAENLLFESIISFDCNFTVFFLLKIFIFDSRHSFLPQWKYFNRLKTRSRDMAFLVRRRISHVNDGVWEAWLLWSTLSFIPRSVPYILHFRPKTSPIIRTPVLQHLLRMPRWVSLLWIFGRCQTFSHWSTIWRKWLKTVSLCGFEWRNPEVIF